MGLRLVLGTAISRTLAWIFARDWPRKLLAHGLSPETKRRLALEISPEALPDQDVAHAYLVKLGPERAWETVLHAARHDFPDARARLTIELARQARYLPKELEALEAAVGDLLLNQERTVAYGLRQFERLRDALDRHAPGWAGKRALELGPGHTLVIPSLLLASGLGSYVGVDLFPIASVDPAIQERLRAELARAARLVGAGSGLLDELDRVAKDAKRLELRCPVDAAKLPFEDGSFDLCLSKSAFEHFRDAPAAAREAVRVLAPGGVGLHEIDLRDHRDFARPLEFLKEDAAAWTARFEKDPFDFTNRLRAGDFAAAFRASGAEVEVVVLDSVKVSDAERASFDPGFRSREREDLETLVALYVVRKPAR